MKTLGIDYGSKRVGLALSNSEATMSTPLEIVKNTADLVPYICTLISQQNIERVVLGESLDYSGKDNTIMVQARACAVLLAECFSGPIEFHTEVMTSMESKWGTEKQVRRSGKDKEVKKIKGKEHIDDIAASIMLQNYLDRHNR